jgi:HlyD family secretion protein
MTRRRKIILGVCGIVLVGAVVAGNLAHSHKKATEVQAEPVKRGLLVSKVRAPGSIQAETTVKISATTFGQVIRVGVKEGERVRKHQFLLALDDTQARAELNEARAALASARARLRFSEASLARAEAMYERNKKLATSNLVSSQELEASETEARTARADRDAYSEQVSQASETVRRAQDNLSKTVYRAPVAGVVSSLNVEEGEMAVTGTMNNPGTVLVVISDMSQMEIWADVDEADIVDVRPLQDVKITVDALPDTSFRGRVREIAASGTSASGLSAGGEQKTNFTVKISFVDAVPKVKPGMSGDVEITTASKKGALYIPIQAVVVRKAEDLKQLDQHRKRREKEARAETRPDTASGEPSKEKEGVFVVKKDGTVEFREIRTGLAGDTDIEIIGPVQAGEKVVTGPYKTLRNLRNGAKVKVVAASFEKGAKKS